MFTAVLETKPILVMEAIVKKVLHTIIYQRLG